MAECRIDAAAISGTSPQCAISSRFAETLGQSREQNKNQSIEQERDHQGCGLAEAQIFEQEFERSEGDGGVGDPHELGAMPTGSQEPEDESQDAVCRPLRRCCGR
jgi:hypothetical protein